MARLVPSLARLKEEIDDRWPSRDRRTDGWLRLPSAGISFGHNPDGIGNVHAMDIDRDGINPDWIIANIRRTKGVLWYIIWSDRLWSMTYNWVPYAYKGASRHRDHMHIEVYHTPTGRGYSGKWNVWNGATQTIGKAPGIDTAWGAADHLAEIKLAGLSVKQAGDNLNGYGISLANLRGR